MSRRAVLRGACGIAVALPFLESLRRSARAADDQPERFISFIHVQAALRDEWSPRGTGSTFELSRILSPLEPVKDRLLVLSNVDNLVAMRMGGNGHVNAGRSLMTAQPFSAGFSASNGHAAGPSIDQALARGLAAPTAYPTLEFGIGGSSVGEYQMLFTGADDPVDLIGRPQEAFTQLFADFDEDEQAATAIERLRRRRQSVLDAVKDSFDGMQSRISQADRLRLEAHADKIRQIELQLDAAAATTCSVPEVAEVPAGYNPSDDAYDDTSARLFIDLMVMALACDLTRVGTLQFTQYHDPHFPWLDLPIPGSRDNWHTLIHELGDVNTIRRVMQWYTEQYLYLIQQLAAVQEGEASLLDNTVAMSIGEFGDASTHLTYRLPIVLAGNVGGRLTTGQHRDLSGKRHGELFAGLLNLYGVDAQTFGHPDFFDEPVSLS